MHTQERFKPFTAVYIIFRKENNILLLRRFNTGYKDGQYSMPAGHLDGNETVIDAGIREAKEETGAIIQPQHLRFVHVMHRKSSTEDGTREYIDFFLECTTWNGGISIKEPTKCDDLSWHDLNTLHPHIIPYIAFVLNEYKKGNSFSLYGWNGEVG